jgi:hypothetical protein
LGYLMEVTLIEFYRYFFNVLFPSNAIQEMSSDALPSSFIDSNVSLR